MSEPRQTQYFAFKDAHSGELVRVEDRGDYCNVSLTNDSEWPVFKAESPDALSLVLLENTPAYNSSRRCPGWGPFKRAQLVPVKVTEVVEVDELPDTEPRVVKTVEVRDIPYRVARSYAKADLPGVDQASATTFWLVELPSGVSLEQAKDWEGELVFGGDKYSQRRVYRVLEAPEEYRDLLKGKPGALFLASGLVY